MIIKAADRLNEVQEYYFSQKLKEIQELNKKGKNIINLGIGSPDLPPSDTTVNALIETAKAKNTHGYQSYGQSLPCFPRLHLCLLMIPLLHSQIQHALEIKPYIYSLDLVSMDIFNELLNH